MEIITLTPDNILDYGFCGYKNPTKHIEMTRKAEWYEKYYTKGLRIKVLISPRDGSQGMIEYIPGEYAHRPVQADKFMFIHCLFVGYKRDYKGQGFGSLLLESCIKDAEDQKMDGVSVVTRKSSFMAKREVFMKKGFISIEKRKPDFELLALKFSETHCSPRFLETASVETYKQGLFILRSPQCPYTEKNVNAMVETAKSMGLEPNIVELTDHEKAQTNPSPFGTFALIYDGEVLSHHPISNKRFMNIMQGKI